MIMNARNVLLLAACSTTWACSSGGEPIDIGDGKKGDKLEDYAAVWEGYVEAHEFSDGSDKVKVTLDASGDGSLEIGDTAHWPAATNPDVGYPPVSVTTGLFYPAEKLFPGISYPISGATIELARLRLSVNPWEVVRDWCALQTSYAHATGPSPYSCLPAPVYENPGPGCRYGSPATSVDCAKAMMCTGQPQACSCDAQGCSIPTDHNHSLGYTKLDAALDDGGSSLVGTLRIGLEPVYQSFTVRLKRISNN